MGTFTIERTIETDVGIERAFEWMMQHDEWRKPAVREVEPLTDGATRVGSRFRNRVRAGGMTVSIINEITVYDPPRRLAWRQVNEEPPMFTAEGNYLLEPLPSGGTRITLRNHHTTVGWGTIVTPMLRLVAGRLGTRLMGNLEEQLGR